MMKNSLTTIIATSLLLAVSNVQGAATINTPASLVECEPAALSWSGGTAPYYLSIIPGGDTSAAALENLGEQTGTSYTWTVDIASGTNVSLALTDSTGVVSYSSTVVILAGTSTTCVGTDSTAASSGTAAGSATAAASAATTTATGSSASSSVSRTSVATTGTTAATSGSSSASAASSSATTTTSGASTKSISFGLLGAAVAFFALRA